MSFTFPNPFKPSQGPSPEMNRPIMHHAIEFDNADDLQVLPYDVAAGKLARQALQFSGPTILRNEFGIDDPHMARQKANELAERVVSIGSTTLYALDRAADIETLWEENALHGDEAKLTVMSLQKLAEARDQGFYANMAADALENIQPSDTRIPLK